MSSSDSTPSAPAPAPTEISEAERRPSARIGAVLFRHRGWLPVPFLLVPLLARGTMQPRNWILGFVLIVLGEAIRLAGVAAAGTVTRRRSRTVQRLVTYGIFAWMRNPLYVGNFLIWIGFTVISGRALVHPRRHPAVRDRVHADRALRGGRARVDLRRRSISPTRRARRAGSPVRPPPRTTRASITGARRGEARSSTFLQYAVITAAFVAKQQYGTGGMVNGCG